MQISFNLTIDEVNISWITTFYAIWSELKFSLIHALKVMLVELICFSKQKAGRWCLIDVHMKIYKYVMCI